MITLYGYWRSTAACRVRIALNYKQISYSQASVHLLKDGGEHHTPEYKTLNPQSLVPTLLDDGFAIGQSMAILEYLEEKYPETSLLPSDMESRAKIRQLCQLITCDVHPLNNLRVLQYLSEKVEINDEQKQDWYHHWLRTGFKAYVALLKQAGGKGELVSNGEYSSGKELSMADVCLIPQIYNATRFNFPMEEFPELMAINNNCLKLEYFQNAMPENQPDAE